MDCQTKRELCTKKARPARLLKPNFRTLHKSGTVDFSPVLTYIGITLGWDCVMARVNRRNDYSKHELL